jgi:hypothetical protein
VGYVVAQNHLILGTENNENRVRENQLLREGERVEILGGRDFATRSWLVSRAMRRGIG